METKPDILVLDGPALYINKRQRETFFHNMERIINEIPEIRIIIDHHTTRDPEWRKDLSEISDHLITFADYNGEKFEPLEGMRKSLWCPRIR